MKKIPSVFERNEGRQCVDKVNPECWWVIDGIGFATEKFDGSACLLRGNRLFRRHRVKAPKEGRVVTLPVGWLHHTADISQRSGHGWLPVTDSPGDIYHREAWQWLKEQIADKRHAGTYELVGPTVQRNPYHLERHQLWRHGGTVIVEPNVAYVDGRSFAGLKELLEFQLYPMEGIVFWDIECSTGPLRMAKVKRKDFGLSWPNMAAKVRHPEEEF